MTFASIFLLQAFVIVAAPVVLLRVCRLKGLMPLVVMQIAVGIALGPSVFGRVAPDYFHMFIRPETLSSLSGLATIAVVMFGLISGLHLDPSVFNGKERTFWPIAVGNVAIPMILGLLAGYGILARHPDELLPGVSPVEFVAAIGICITMKALPVLGAILGEMDLFGTRIGHLALGVAGVIDITLWIALAVLLTAAAAGHAGEAHGLPPIYLIISVPLYLFLMVRIVRPVLGSMLAARIPVRVKDRMLVKEVNARALVVVGAATIASALTTELMGLHYIIGAFLIGVIMPAHLRQPIIDRLQVVTVALLMPFFFALTGMRTLIDQGFSHIARGVYHHHWGRGNRRHRRHRGARAAFWRNVVIWSQPRISAAGQRSDGTHRSDHSPGRWDRFPQNLRGHDSHGAGLHGPRHALGAPDPRQAGRAAADRGADIRRTTDIARHAGASR
jgi:Kef-type K+ transport system membrane component KefB